MNCHSVKNIINTIFDKEASPESVSMVNAHIKDCPDCARLYSDTKAVIDVLRKDLRRPAPDGFSAGVMSLIASEEADVREIPRGLRGFKALARIRYAGFFAAGAVAAVLIFTVLPRRHKSVIYVSPGGSTTVAAGYRPAAVFTDESSGYVRINLASAAELKGVTVEINLPKGLTLSDGKSSLVWSGDLALGNNVILLKVSGRTGSAWAIDGVIRKNGLEKSFRKSVNVI